MQTYDVIVLGAGGVGSAALAELTRRGVRRAGHRPLPSAARSRQQSRPDSRHPPSLLRAPGLRAAAEGGLSDVAGAGSGDGPAVVPSSRPLGDRSARRRGRAGRVTCRGGAPVAGRTRNGRQPPTAMVLPCGPRKATSACTSRTRAICSWRIASPRSLRRAAAGAALLTDTTVHDWTAADGVVQVRTSAGDFEAASLIVAAGAWASSLWTGRLIDQSERDAMNIRLTVRRKSLFWFAACSPRNDAAAGMPVFLFELPAGVFYGFPRIDGRSVKLAEHSGGATVEDPANVDRAIDPEEQRRLQSFVTAHLPEVSPQIADHAVCLYTMSPDEHFLVDRHPRTQTWSSPRACRATASSSRRCLAGRWRICADGATPLPIEFLSIKRFR